jgi:hypothetical protein
MKIAEVQDIMMQFANESSNVGFSFGIADSIPKTLKLPKPPIESLKFIDIDFVGTTPDNQYTDFSNTGSFISSPQMGITVERAANLTKLQDGCPDIKLFALDESEKNLWENLAKPLRDKTRDTEASCAYILDLEHFSKFSVGGVRPS